MGHVTNCGSVWLSWTWTKPSAVKLESIYLGCSYPYFIQSLTSDNNSGGITEHLKRLESFIKDFEESCSIIIIPWYALNEVIVMYWSFEDIVEFVILNLTLNLAINFTCILMCCNYCVGYCLQVSSSLISIRLRPTSSKFFQIYLSHVKFPSCDDRRPGTFTAAENI